MIKTFAPACLSRSQCWTGDPDPQYRRTQFEEAGWLAGSIGGGISGGYAGLYLSCNVLFGVQTAGSSLLWCGISGAVAGGYVGSRYIGQVAEGVGSMLYETRYQSR